MIKKHFSLDELFVFHYRIKFEEELNNEEDFALQSEYFSNAYQSYYKMILKIKGDFFKPYADELFVKDAVELNNVHEKYASIKTLRKLRKS